VTKDSCWIWPIRRRDELDLGDKKRSRAKDFAEKERRAMSESAGGAVVEEEGIAGQPLVVEGVALGH
jgi:hypothetical protein